MNYKSLYFFITILLSTYTYSAFALMAGFDLRLGSPDLKFSFESDTKKLIFEPNRLNEITLGFIGDSYTFQLKVSYEPDVDVDDEEALDSGYGDYLFTYYSNRFVVDLYYQDYEGFHIIADEDEFTSPESAPQLKGSNFGMTFHYFLSDSFKLSESYTEFVTSPKTAHSLILGGNLNMHSLEGNDTIIPAKYAAEFEDINSLEKLTADSFDLQAGYAFLYAWDYFYLSMNLNVGPGVLNKKLYLADDEKAEVQSTYKGQGFFGFSYYDNDIQVGVRTKYYATQTELTGIKYTYENMVNYMYFLMIF